MSPAQHQELGEPPYPDPPDTEDSLVESPGFINYQSKYASIEQLFHALDFIVSILEEKNVPYGLMGGLSLVIRGNTRMTSDVDIAVECSMGELQTWMKSKPDRILQLAGPVSGHMRVYVQVGGIHNPGIADERVAVDFVIAGLQLGVPCNFLDAREEVPRVNPNVGVANRNYWLLKVATIVEIKLEAYDNRKIRSSKDFGDIIWLITRLPKDVSAAWHAPHLKYLWAGVVAEAHETLRHTDDGYRLTEVLGGWGTRF